MAEAGQCLPVHGEDLVPLTQLAVIRGLSLSQHRLDNNPKVALCRVPTSDNREAEGPLARPLLEVDREECLAGGGAPVLPEQRAVAGAGD